MYVELHLHTPFSFLDGGSDIEELVKRAADLGMRALAVTDHNTLTAAVKFNSLCRAYNVKPIFGAELTLSDGSHLTLLAKSRQGYGNLCHLLSLGFQHGGRLSPSLPWEHLPTHAEGIVCLTGCRKGAIPALIRDHRFEEALRFAEKLKEWFGDDLYIELQDDYTPHARGLCRDLSLLARRIGAQCVATNNVHYATRDGLIAHDIKRCIAAGITIADEHETRPLNAERYLKSGLEMAALFDWRPEAISTTEHIADQCAKDGIAPIGEEVVPRYHWLPSGRNSAEHLRELAEEGAKRRRGAKAETYPAKKRLAYELKLLETLGYTDFVLHAARIVREARAMGVMVTGRGSGADSEVCFCLGLTDIDVLERNLPVARWVAPGKKPDIDIDFDARRRDDVFRMVAQQYTPERVALCCTYMCYQGKGAVRDIGKALALPEDALEWFRKHISGFVSAAEIGAAFGKYAELRDYGAFIDRFALLFDLCRRIADHPRHLGSHSSGLVIGGAPLSTLNVVTPSARGVLPIVMLDKDDVEEAGAIKLDILSLPILAVVQDSSASIRKTVPGFEYDQIPREDMETYRMLWSGDNMGLFQLGSPAQAALATRLHPRHFEDLVAAIGLIRPGPIRSQAARNYVAARNGYARIEVLHPSLEPILRRTHGVMCFQEQVGLVIGAMMGLSDVDADVWRKALTKHAKRGTMQQARDEFIARSTARHRDLRPDRAHRLMDELEGWVGLGFVEGHSASFALTGQKTAWMLRYHPTEYYAALLSNQPCGFYPPQSIASEARRRGAQIRPVDINLSRLECLIETDEDAPQSIRLGFCLVSGMREADIETILASRDSVGPLHSLLDFCKRVTIPRNCVENLIICGAFDALHDRRRSGLMWRLDETLGKAAVLRAQELESGNRLDLRFFGETETPLAWDVPEPSEWEAMLLEWAHVGVTSSCHPFAHVREALQRDGVISTHEAKQRAHHSRVRLAGLNVRPHRPPSKTGGRHLFCVLEDETGYLQLAFYGESIDNCTSVILSSPVIVVDGIVKRRGTGVGIEVFRAEPLSMERLVQSSFTVDMLTQPPVRPAAAR